MGSKTQAVMWINLKKEKKKTTTTGNRKQQEGYFLQKAKFCVKKLQENVIN